MPSKAKIKGELTLPGLEVSVDKYRKLEDELATISKEVSDLKNAFRKAAFTAMAGVDAEISKVNFLGTNGDSVAVSQPDYTRPGNRLKVKESLVAEAEISGIELDELCFETHRSYVLKGDWVDWMDGYIAQMKSAGADFSYNGLDLKEEKKLSVKGLQVLQQHTKAGPDSGARSVAQKLLDACRKAFSVR